MNVHLLSHLATCVYNCGPVWCNSCFGFESRNADLKRLFHGSRDMSRQVAMCMEVMIVLYYPNLSQMAFSYVWMQTIHKQMTKLNPDSRTQAVHNILVGQKRYDVCIISTRC